MSPSLLFLLFLPVKSVFLAASAYVPMLSALLFLIADEITVHCSLARKRAETVDRGRLRSRQQSHDPMMASRRAKRKKYRNLGMRRFDFGFAISKESSFLWRSHRKTMHARIMEMWITRTS